MPAFDPRIVNPVGWKWNVDQVVGALGARRLLPPGIKAHRMVRPNDMGAARLCHHLVDVEGFHADEFERAGVLVRLAATGAPVFLADGGRKLAALIGNDLHALMTKGVREGDLDARESLSIKMRRIALREHSYASRARQMGEAVLGDPPKVPSVSILLGTKRPNCLTWAVENVARQNYPRLQLVLALHGDGFESASVERATRRLRFPVRVVRIGRSETFATVLNAAVNESNGDLLTKMDDDDLYGPEHIWDLVLAHEYSGAQLVGKALETVYLAHRDQTVRRFRRHGETYNRYIAGGTLLISRRDLDRIGGWQGVPPFVDKTLIDNVARAGAVYRTHASGYLMYRHGQAHTWEADDGVFLNRAHAVLPGWRPSVAYIEDGPERPPSFQPT